jgi:hypothetical protein
VLGLLGSVPSALRAQQNSSDDKSSLGAFPNPVNPDKFIPFQLKGEFFVGGHRPIVSLKIYNMLAQVVAVPIVQGSGEKLDNASLSWNGTGDYTAYWDGKIQGTGREATSGVYVYQLIVNWQQNGRDLTKTAFGRVTVPR